jgi:HSP20 family protein
LTSFTRLGPSDVTVSAHFASSGSAWSAPNCPHCAEWSPAIDAFEYSDAVVLKVDLPGISLEDVEIHTGPSLLTIRGERALEAVSPTEEGRMIERGFGRFRRAFALPESVDRQEIAVTLHAGVLEIRLPKRGDKPRHPEPSEAANPVGGSEPVTHCEWCGAEYPLPDGAP